MSERYLNARGFHVHNDQEYCDGCNKCENIRTKECKIVSAIDTNSNQAGEEPDRILVSNRHPVDEPIDNCLRYTGNNKETHPRADTPFCHYFIHKKDQHATDTDLDEDQE